MGQVLQFTPEIERETAALYERVKHIIPEIEWRQHAPYVARINQLKREIGAVILAHNYQTPEIFHCVSDFTGDSLQLAREAARSDAKIIVQAGVHFMAETSKILSPEKTVLIPSMEAGCSLASSITGADVRLLRERFPGVPIVTYVNTSAEVKAESDICCTSSNAVDVVESLGAPRVLMIPDQYLAKNVANQTDVEILTWAGSCEVHERFSADDIRAFRKSHPGVIVLAHPECPPEVVAEADFAGSTSAMIGYVEQKRVVDSGAHGRPVMVHSIGRGVTTGPGATNETVIYNSAIHDIDVVPWLLGAPVTSVSWHSPETPSGQNGDAAKLRLMLPAHFLHRPLSFPLRMWLQNAQRGGKRRSSNPEKALMVAPVLSIESNYSVSLARRPLYRLVTLWFPIML